MTTPRVYDSLDSALDDFDIPLENRDAIRQAMASVDVERYEATSRYIKAIRAGEGPDLRIEKGFTNGFVSEAEASRAASPADVWRSSGRAGLWGMTHPSSSVAAGGPATRKSRPVDFVERRADERDVLSVAQEAFTYMLNGGSFLANHNVWSDESLGVLFKRFVEADGVPGKSFRDQMQEQLSGLDSDDPIVLFAELMLLDMLPLLPRSLKAATKAKWLEDVLGLAHGDYPLTPRILNVLQVGIFQGGQRYSTTRPRHLSTLLELTRAWRALPAAQRESADSDPWAWRALIDSLPGRPEASINNTLLYLKHPSTFLPISSQSDKEKIAQAFCPLWLGVEASNDVDRDLLALEQYYLETHETPPDYYLDAQLARQWQSGGDTAGDVPSAKALTVDAQPAEAGELEPVLEYKTADILRDGCFQPLAELELALKRWFDKKNLILEGAPGTGKTWVARRLAYALIGSKDPRAVRAVQFHPGTSYEDFVRGWRPGGDGTLRLEDGPLLQHAERARAHPDVPHVLLIEEINRGNPAQAFGELLTLIEGTKRAPSDAIELAYHAEDEGPFHLPPNFYIIGTMNIADRSLALVDFALRRRFAFLRLEPQFNEAWETALKRQFHQLSAETLETIRARMSGLNDFIRTDPSLGGSFLVGHSFVTPTQGHSDPVAWFKDVARTDIGPLLDEYWFDSPETAGEQRQRLVEGL